MFRIYVERRPGFQSEAQTILSEINGFLGISSVKGVRYFNRYDIENTSEDVSKAAALRIFSEPQSDLVAYDENRNLLYNALTEMGYECAKPHGAFYLFVKAPNGDANAFSEKAKLEHNLLVVPADGFGCPGFFRLSYCVANDMIKRSLPAFKAMIESYK